MTGRFHPQATRIQPGSGSALTYAGLEIVTLSRGETHRWQTGPDETAVVPLAGAAIVTVDGTAFELEGRESVFTGPTDFVYTPIGATGTITATRPGRFALCRARTDQRLEPYRVAASAVPVEVRGGGPATRQINNFLAAGVHDAAKLIAVEVITPSGGWSSYPPHKHDEFTADEVALEEIYYFEIAAEGFGFFTAYTADGTIADTVTVRTGDAYLVPDGYHGPAAAAPGYHMYYLNVMAGPGDERVWRFCDDPAHAGLRQWLDTLPPDPRLPMMRPRS